MPYNDGVRAGLLPECYIVPLEKRDERQVIMHRIGLVQDRTRAMDRIRSLLDKYDIALDVSSLYSKKGLKLLSKVELDSEHDHETFKQIVENIEYLTKAISNADERIRKMASGNDYAKILTSMTGLDYFGAMLLALEIDDIGRFPDPRKLVSWTGMCPTVSQSGDSTYYGRMKKTPNRKVNWMLIQAANVASRTDPKMSKHYERIKAGHGGKHNIAVTHVANRMTRIIWQMLTRSELYEG